MKARRNLYTEIAGEITTAIREVLARHEDALRRRKESRDRLNYWISVGANAACRSVRAGRGKQLKLELGL
jgi:hypothetical protein